MPSNPGRALLFAAAAATLLAGMTAGLQRLGFDLAMNMANGELALIHGPLMVCGFFGTVIGLERAVALNKNWSFSAPLFSSAGALGLIAGLPTQPMIGLLLLGSLLFLAVAIEVVRRQPALYTVALALGAAAWAAGTLACYLTGAIPPAAAAWACFLVLTIAGERLELSRFLPPNRWKRPSALLIFAMLLTGAGLLCTGHDAGATLFGGALIAEAIWLFRFDVVRNTIRQTGLTRYMAICLASGYVWLVLSGALVLAYGLPQGGPLYDAILHGLFVGFVFAMVFGHMPVILPALLKIPQPYRPRLYAPLIMLHASLILRIAGDLADWDEARRWGSLLNAVTVLVFLALTAHAVSRRRAPSGAYTKPTTGCGTYASSRNAISSDDRPSDKAARASSRCWGLDAPMIGDVTPDFWATQAKATWARGTPRALATVATLSITRRSASSVAE